jgi:hypothetical protein
MDSCPEIPLAQVKTEEASGSMLSITPRALCVMQRVTGHPTLEPTSGLRIASRAEESEPLLVRAVHRPLPGDEVLERNGARLYLDEHAAGKIANRELDAVTEPDGRVQFILRKAA